MNTTKQYINEITQNFPDFKVETVQILGEGMMSIVLEVNKKWAFRFAKSTLASLDLEKEINILPYIHSKVSFSIPSFDFVGKQENGFYFVGYKKLPGELLKEDSIAMFSRIQVRNLIQSLSEFITQLQSISIDSAERRVVPTINLETKTLKLYEEAKEKVFPLLDEKTKANVCNRIETFLNHQDYHTYTPKLIHGDLSPDHFLVDRETGKLTGIIDFGDMCICDPDYEFIYMMEDCGKEFTRDLVRSLGCSNVEERLNKISYFVTFDQIRYTIDGVIRKDESWIQEGLKELERDMRDNSGEV